ncbi:hypothetical protein BD770DRAFT_415377 [Pilaira anomala]|nr:hypothetical protein BD770DRAFT_415377 [Pilaira anomala]
MRFSLHLVSSYLELKYKMTDLPNLMLRQYLDLKENATIHLGRQNGQIVPFRKFCIYPYLNKMAGFVKIQHTVDNDFILRIMSYAISIYRQYYNKIPIVLTFVITSMKYEVSKKTVLFLFLIDEESKGIENFKAIQI